jgi:hypothetical protein
MAMMSRTGAPEASLRIVMPYRPAPTARSIA